MCAKIVICLTSLIFALQVSAGDLTVQAASSLTDAMKEIGRAYAEQGNAEVHFNFGASSLLARQIEEGAPADIFLSADEAKMDALEKAGLLAPGTRRTLLSNTLVIAIPKESALQIRAANDLATNPSIKKIALAQPESVPAGIYAKQYLTRLGLWDKIAPKVIPTANVRAVLAVVESGNVDAGFVYRSDMLNTQSAKIALEIPANKGPKISSPVAVIAATSHLDAAKKFVAYLESEPAHAIFQKWGFTIVGE